MSNYYECMQMSSKTMNFSMLHSLMWSIGVPLLRGSALGSSRYNQQGGNCVPKRKAMPCSPDGFFEVGTYELLFYCEDEDLTSQVILAAHSDAELDPISDSLAQRYTEYRSIDVRVSKEQPTTILPSRLNHHIEHVESKSNCFC